MGGTQPTQTETETRTPSIGLFELTWHPQNLRELCRIVDTEANDVTVFTSEELYERWLADADLEAEGEDAAFSWVLQGEDESLASYFDRAETYCSETLDFLMVLTPFGSGIITSHFVEFDPDCTSVCWLYNSRACIESTREATDARTTLRDATPELRRALVPEDRETAERSLKPHRYYMRPYILENYDGYVVEYPPIRRYLEENWEWTRAQGGDRPVVDFSPYVYEGADDDADSRAGADDGAPGRFAEPVSVTVSGRVVENVRDYDQVLDVFESLFPEHGDALELNVLGRPVGDYGDRIVDRCRDLESQGYQVTYYPDTDWVPAEEFDAVLERSDVLLNPIYLVEETTREPAPDERRSRTKGTGVLFDALKHGKPLVLPEGFVVDSMIEGSTLTYDSEAELRRLLEGLVSDPRPLATLRDRAERNAAAFTRAKQRERFDELVGTIRSAADDSAAVGRRGRDR
ncbi:hypothetical protein [Halopiger thermotolerans]